MLKRSFVRLAVAITFVACGIWPAFAASKATNIEFLLSQVRQTTGNLAGGTVTVAAAGDATSTPVTIWIDRNKATPAANPYTLDANGTAQLYADGLIKVVLKNAAGTTVYTRDNLNYVDYLTSGAYQAIDSDYASLNAAITAIGSTPTTLTIRGANFPLTGAAVVPSTLVIKVEYPGSINQSAYTLTINGPFYASLSQGFTGTGAVTGLAYVNPIWFANTQAGNQLAFNAVATGGVLELTTTRTVTAISVPNAITIKGSGGLTQAIGDVASNVLTLAADGTIVDGITITGPVTTGNANHSNIAAINIAGRSDINIRNCTLTGKQNGIQNINSVTGVTNVLIENNTIRYTGYGMVLWPTNDPTGIHTVTTDYGSHLRIIGNDVWLQAGFDATSENIRGIRVSHYDNVLIQGNTSLGASLSIESWCDTVNRVAKNVSFVNNTVDLWLSLDAVDGGIIQGNKVDYSLRPAIYRTSTTYGAAAGIETIRASNVDIIGNFVANLPANGIYTGYAGNGPGSTTTSHNVNIANNVINSCALSTNYSAGIQLGYVHDVSVKNNLVTGCGGATNGSYAIASGGKIASGTFFNPVYNIDIVGNTILDTTVGHATSPSTAHSGAVFLYNIKDVLLSGNVIKNTIGTVGNGLSLGNAFTSNVKINGNVISNNSGYGLFTVTGAGLKDVLVENNDLSGNGAGGCDSATPEIYMALRWNKGLVGVGNANTHNTFEIGDIYNITHGTNKWVRCTVAGTQIVGAPITLNTVIATASTNPTFPATIAVNNAAALALEPGQYISIVGVAGTKKVLFITYTIDTDTSNVTNKGFTGATVVLDSACNVTNVVDGAIHYEAGTVGQVL